MPERRRPDRALDGTPRTRLITFIGACIAGDGRVIVAYLGAPAATGGRVKPPGRAMVARVELARRQALAPGDTVEALDDVVVCVVSDEESTRGETRFDRFVDLLWSTGPFVMGYAERTPGETPTALLDRAATRYALARGRRSPPYA